ncbi:hypothetical protein EVAR_32748_1 [Eumeta japonica]|uniref:Uncharacterized protein n=1 Tax=Eumeta variegata TaxID=151549 RepID=A0A4C1XN83_EUMVA|nr:hypothetical protein EVAR_32748_1 [Eumeta japonica]
MANGAETTRKSQLFLKAFYDAAFGRFKFIGATADCWRHITRDRPTVLRVRDDLSRTQQVAGSNVDSDSITSLSPRPAQDQRGVLRVESLDQNIRLWEDIHTPEMGLQGPAPKGNKIIIAPNCGLIVRYTAKDNAPFLSNKADYGHARLCSATLGSDRV